MSTNDVPGFKPENRDELAAGCWAEHDDGSLIFVQGNEGGRVIYSMFDMAVDPPVEYRDGMNELSFKKTFTFDPKDDGSIQWVWHDKTPFPWERIMGDFPAGPQPSSAVAVKTAAQRVAESLRLRAEQVQPQRAATGILVRLRDAIDRLIP